VEIGEAVRAACARGLDLLVCVVVEDLLSELVSRVWQIRFTLTPASAASESSLGGCVEWKSAKQYRHSAAFLRLAGKEPVSGASLCGNKNLATGQGHALRPDLDSSGMVYIENLENFMQAAQELFVNAPERTRYVIKYRHVDAKLVLKVTDDKVCLKYKTDQAEDAKKVAKLNAFFLNLMSAAKVDSESARQVFAAVDEQEQQAAAAQQSQPAQQKKGGKKR